MSAVPPVSLVKKLVVLAVALIIVLALGEVTLRLFAPFPDYTCSSIRCFPDGYHPLLGYAGIPRLDTRFVLPDFDHRLLNNSKGFRDRERSHEKGGAQRIVVLGDSTAWGWGVEAEDRFSDLLERQLEGWEVINLANPGYSTDQELLLLETEGLNYRPDIVLLLFDRNDVVEGNNARQIDGMQPKPYFVEEGGKLVLRNSPVPFDEAYWAKKLMLASSYGVPGEQDRSSWSGAYWRERVLTKSHLYNWIAFRLAHPVRGRGGSVEPPPDLQKLKSELVLTKQLLTRIDTLCRERGARFVIADIHSAYSPLLGEFCRGQKIPYMDLGPVLDGRIRPVVHRRVGHWTPYGHRLAALAIEKFLQEKQII